jgi:hypothetical protein
MFPEKTNSGSLGFRYNQASLYRYVHTYITCAYTQMNVCVGQKILVNVVIFHYYLRIIWPPNEMRNNTETYIPTFLNVIMIFKISIL